MFKAPEKYRVKTGKMKSSEALGNNGVFIVPLPKKLMKSQVFLQVIASDGHGWEHCSVVPIYKSGKPIGRVPLWEEMDMVKNLFWSDEDKPEIVVQFHIPPILKIQTFKYSLHLWKKIGAIYELPPKRLV